MEPEAVDTVRLLLFIVIVGCVTLLTVVFPITDAQGEGPTPFRDLDREHRLGGHRETAHPQCPKCKRGEV